MPRKQKKYHYIYRTTCVVTGKFYVGMHSTDDLNDGYLGSGKILGYSLNKHGRENHKIEILEMCGSREQLKQREREIVNEALLADPLNINLKYGGEGGWDQQKNSNLVLTKEQLSERSKRGWITLRNDADAFASFCQKAKKQGTALNEWITVQEKTTGRRIRGFDGRKHSEEARNKIGQKNSIYQTGNKNSQFGTKWVTSKETGAIKIRADQLDRYLDMGFTAGRKT